MGMVSSRIPLVVIISALILAATAAAIIVLVSLGNSLMTPGGNGSIASDTISGAAPLGAPGYSTSFAGDTHRATTAAAASVCTEKPTTAPELSALN